MANTRRGNRGKLYTGTEGLKKLPNGTWVEDYEQYKRDNPGVNLEKVKKNAKKALIALNKKKNRESLKSKST